MFNLLSALLVMLAIGFGVLVIVFVACAALVIITTAIRSIKNTKNK